MSIRDPAGAISDDLPSYACPSGVKRIGARDTDNTVRKEIDPLTCRAAWLATTGSAAAGWALGGKNEWQTARAFRSV
jgi:hypothetical protein